MSSKINLQTCEYARKSSIFQDNQLILSKKQIIFHILGFYVPEKVIRSENYVS